MKKTNKNDNIKPQKEAKLLEAGHEEVLLTATTERANGNEEKTELDESPTMAFDAVSTDEDKKLTPFDKKEIELLSVSTVESIEVEDPKDGTASEDPDKTVTIVRPSKPAQWWQKRSVLLPVGVVVVVVLLLAIPAVRFMALGWIWHRDVTIAVVDSRSGSAISGAQVVIGSRTVTTGGNGTAMFASIPIGEQTATVTKKFYTSASQKVTVDIFSADKTAIKVAATGTITTLEVRDRLTDAPVANAVLASGGTTLGRTNDAGTVQAVIPNGKKEAPVTVTVPGYNVLQATITSETRMLQLIPSGSLYFLDRQDGKINVVKTNLDGSDRKVVVPGTGNESDKTTYLSVSKDWKFAVLRAKRAPNKPEALYVVTAKDDKLAVIDDGTVQFTPIGWSGQYFVYQSMRTGADQWRERTTQLKSYNAETGKTVVLDENASELTSTENNALYEAVGGYYLTDTLVSYTKVWTALGDKTLPKDGKQSAIMTVKPDGSEHKSVKSFPAQDIMTITAKSAQPGTVYYRIQPSADNAPYSYGELTSGAYRDAVNTAAIDSKTHPRYLSSPDGSRTLWAEEAAESVTLYSGNGSGDEKKEIRPKSLYRPYAWLTNDRVIVWRGGDLYVTTLTQLAKDAEPLKVGGFYRPTDQIGYGYGTQ